MLSKEQIALAEHAVRLDAEMKRTAYKAVIASVAEQIWQRPMRKEQAEQVKHLQSVFRPEVIVEVPMIKSPIQND